MLLKDFFLLGFLQFGKLFFFLFYYLCFLFTFYDVWSAGICGPTKKHISLYERGNVSLISKHLCESNELFNATWINKLNIRDWNK